MGKIRVYVADWQELFRIGIRYTLAGASDAEFVGGTGRHEEALDFIASTPPDVAILNIGAGRPSGLEIARAIREKKLPVVVILVMDRFREDYLLAAMKSGASACISKDIDPRSLVRLINEVAGGARPLGRALLRPALARHVLQVAGTDIALSPEERDILVRIAGTDLPEHNAETLGISAASLERLLASILSKLVNDLQGSIVQRLESFFKDRGYEVEAPAWREGRPGMVCSFDILASRDDRIIQYRIGIRILTAGVGEAGVSVRDLMNFRSEAADAGIDSLGVVAIPALSPEAQDFAEKQGIKVFTVREVMDLPVVAVEQDRDVKITVPPAPTAGTAGLKKILWFEGDTATSARYAPVLKTAGFEVMVFDDPDRGLPRLPEASLVLVDGGPVRAGELVPRIRERSSVPIIFLGGGKKETAVQRPEGTPSADIYLDRSISGRELIARIRSVLRRQ